MGLSGVLNVEVEVKSPPEKFWKALGDGVNLLPKAFPHDYKTIQVLAGDGNSPGSIRLIFYGEGTLFNIVLMHREYGIIILYSARNLFFKKKKKKLVMIYSYRSEDQSMILYVKEP